MILNHSIAFILLFCTIYLQSIGASKIEEIQELLVLPTNKGGLFQMNARTCNKWRQEKTTKVINYLPSDTYNYEKIGFQKYDGDCDAAEEDKLFDELLEIAKKTGANRRNSLEWYADQWSLSWNNKIKNVTINKKICNPVWLLECKSGKCKCRTTGMTDFMLNEKDGNPNKIKLVLEKILIENCTGNTVDKCQREFVDEGAYRCVAASSHKNNVGNEWNYNGCGFYFPPIDKCSINCEHESDCTSLAKVHDYHQDEFRACCGVNSKHCEVNGKDHNFGSIVNINYALLVGAAVIIAFGEKLLELAF